MNKAKAIQKQLFYDISQILEIRQLKTDHLLSLLNIKKTALYSRINGTKLLTLKELAILSDAFDLNFNNYFHLNRKGIQVYIPSLEHTITSEREYVDGLLQRLIKMSQLSGIHIYYISSEIPVLNYFRYKELALFKLYIYGKTVWELPHLQEQRFDLSMETDDSYDHSFKQLNDIYTSIPSTEIWSTNFVDNTLSQIKYYAQAGMFENKEDIFLLLKQLNELVKGLEKSAREGHKFYKNGEVGNSFSIFHNEITHTNNIVLFDSHSKKFTFSTYDNPNYMETTNLPFWNYTFNCFTKKQKRSHSISNESERSRRMLFNLCYRKIAILEKLIQTRPNLT